MIVAAITDKLGNQMFQYAAAKGLALFKDTSLKIDKRYYNYNAPKGFYYELGDFCIEQNFISNKEVKEYTGLSNLVFHKVIRKIYKSYQKSNSNFIYDEPFFHYDYKIKELGNEVYLRGYWQSYKYFNHIEKELRKDFTLKNPVDIKNDFFAKRILDTNSVCISVRRGDHITNLKINQKYGQSSLNYYIQALELIKAKSSELSLFVFSDDIFWCKENLKFDFPTHFVHYPSQNLPPSYYLKIMSLCNHFVIPVSTFPWWGAWLGEHTDKIVIAPKIWFTDLSINTNDLIPNDWIRI